MRIGSLFSGIGGLELGLERAIPGAHTVFQVEQNKYARAVLAKHWPNAQRFDDVKEVGAHNLPACDLLCGGFPCQDLSALNSNGTGLEGSRSGLWGEFARIAGELEPRWIIVENVHHTWRRWVPSVRRDLYRLGYASVPLRLSAADVGARHRRRRVFILAHPDGQQLRKLPRWWSRQDGQGAPESAKPNRWPAPPEPCRAPHGLSHRVDRLRCLGNAVVPQVAEVMGRVVMQLEEGSA